MLPTVMMDTNSIMAETTVAADKRSLIANNTSVDATSPLDKINIEESSSSCDKSQEELSNMLRLVIANFCEQHFVKQIQKAKLQSIPIAQTTTTNITIQDNDINTTTANKLNTNNETNDTSLKKNEIIENDQLEMSKKEAEDKQTEIKMSDTSSPSPSEKKSPENNTNNSRDTPPPSSSSPSSSSSSDIAMNCESDSSSPLSKSNEIINNANVNEVEQTDRTETTLLEAAESAETTTTTATKKTAEKITSSTDENMTDRLLQIDDDYLIPPSSKLWSTLLIGADKLEIFGSIHVRTNNIRLLSCLIDEQLSIDSTMNSDSSLSYSSAASISSSGGGDLCSTSKIMMMNKLSHQKFVANVTSGARLMTESALKQVNAGIAASILGANRNNNASMRHNYNQHHHHNHHHSSHHKRSRRYRNHYHNHHSHNHYVRDNTNNQRCCQLNSIVYANRKIESSLNSNATNGIKNNIMNANNTQISGSSRRKNTHLFATPRNTASVIPTAYTDSEQNEYIDDEETVVMNTAMPNKLLKKDSGIINLENDHVIINNGESSSSSANANNVVTCFGMGEYENEEFEEEDVQDEYGHFSSKKKTRKSASNNNGKIDVNGRVKNAEMNDETNIMHSNLEGDKDLNTTSEVNDISNEQESEVMSKADAMVYPIKKFKAYHHYCNNKRKLIQEEQLKQQQQQDLIKESNSQDLNDENKPYFNGRHESSSSTLSSTSNEINENNLTNLANVAAAATAMKLAGGVAVIGGEKSPNTSLTPSTSPPANSNGTTKKSRKSAVVQIQSNTANGILDHNNESELDYDEDDDVMDEIHNGSVVLEGGVGAVKKSKLDYPYLYEDDVLNYDDDNSSVVSGGSSTYSNDSFRNNGPHRHHNQRGRRNRNSRHHRHRSHSRSSSILSGVSSRSASINNTNGIDLHSGSSRSPSCIRQNSKSHHHKKPIGRHLGHHGQQQHRRGISPTSSLASSTFSNDYDDENAYRSYSSSSSYKSDFENYDFDNEENNTSDRHRSRKMLVSNAGGTTESRDNSQKKVSRSANRYFQHQPRDKSNGSTIINELVNDDENIQFDNNDIETTKDKNGIIEIKEKVNGHITNGTYYLNTSSNREHKSHHHRHHRRKPHRISSHHHHNQDLIMDTVLPVNSSSSLQGQSSSKLADREASDLITHHQQSQLTSSKSPNNNNELHQGEDRKREDEYLMRKYKRRFTPYVNGGINGGNQAQQQLQSNGIENSLNGLDTNSNLYLLASSRQHHRYSNGNNNSNTSDLVTKDSNNIPNTNGNHHYDHLNQKLIVDRLSPISDPDLENGGVRSGKNNINNNNHHHSADVNYNTIESIKMTNGGGILPHMNAARLHHRDLLHHHHNGEQNNGNTNNNDISILNRINNLSPSSSSSSSSSIKQIGSSNGVVTNGQAISGVFHHTTVPQQNSTAAAVLAAAAAAAAAADLRGMSAASGGTSVPGGASSSHHTNGHHHQLSQPMHHNHHAQSVAALLADMQQQQQQQNHTQQQQDVAKALAASLTNGGQFHHLNHAHQNNILSRFSNSANQNELMAAVLAQQQQQQQQHHHQQHRSLLDSHHHHHSIHNGHHNGHHNGNGYGATLNASNGQLYSRYSSHINAAVAAAAAAASSAAAAAAHSSSHRRANSVESDATPSPPATTPASGGTGNSSNGNGQLSNSSSISSSSSSSSSSSDNYTNSKYKMNDEMCSNKSHSSKERSSSVSNTSPSSSNNEMNSNSGGGEKVRLVPGFDVFISTNDLNACNDDRGSATRLLRNLMDVFFDKSTLAKSSINGTGRITNTLDKHVISALFAYVKNRYVDVPHSQLTRAATDKCVQTRRNFRKKIKAAQSYFGMFPSIMMARPPQLTPGSENSLKYDNSLKYENSA